MGGDWIWSRSIDRCASDCEGRKGVERCSCSIDQRLGLRGVGRSTGRDSIDHCKGRHQATKGGSPENGGLVGASLRLARAGDTAF